MTKLLADFMDKNNNGGLVIIFGVFVIVIATILTQSVIIPLILFLFLLYAVLSVHIIK